MTPGRVQVEVSPDNRWVRLVVQEHGGGVTLKCDLDVDTAREVSGWLLQGVAHVERANGAAR